eukprot:5780595-Pleurochrysis_carterae.AAC.1
MNHAVRCRSHLIQSRTFDTPSPRVPTFASASSAAPATAPSAPTTRSQSQSGAAPTATSATASAQPVSTTPSLLAPLTPDESKRFIFAP